MKYTPLLSAAIVLRPQGGVPGCQPQRERAILAVIPDDQIEKGSNALPSKPSAWGTPLYRGIGSLG